MQTQPEVYERIYGSRERVPGYQRYRRLRAGALAASRPLEWLAAQEDVYWAVAKEIARCAHPGANVLEVGSGLGYLTHALRKAGYQAEGIDLSEAAVSEATRTFGPHFQASTMDRVGMHSSRYSCVVALELLEHVEDPSSFIAKALQLLMPGGSLIVTTPNKDIYPTHWAWHTDPAPVHLWWFSKSSLRRMAWANDATVTFTDLSGFYGAYKPKPLFKATKPATFGPDGELVFKDGLVNTVARAVMARWPSSTRWIGRIFLARLGRARSSLELGRHGLSHCAVFRKADH